MSARAYTLQPGEGAGCYYCQLRGWHPYIDGLKHYQRGEVVLADAAHPPYDGNANYICLGHLEADTVVYDRESGGLRIISIRDYAKLGRPEVTAAMGF